MQSMSIFNHCSNTVITNGYVYRHSTSRQPLKYGAYLGSPTMRRVPKPFIRYEPITNAQEYLERHSKDISTSRGMCLTNEFLDLAFTSERRSTSRLLHIQSLAPSKTSKLVAFKRTNGVQPCAMATMVVHFMLWRSMKRFASRHAIR